MFAEFLMTAPIMVGAKEICKIPGALKRLVFSEWKEQISNKETSRIPPE